MKQIVVGLDGSAHAVGVLAMAILMARAQSGTVTLVRSVGVPQEIPKDLWKTTDEPLLDVLRRRSESYLKECATEVPPDMFAGLEVVVGVPWQAICEAAKRIRADVIVIGSHGHAGLDHLLGTTAAKVVNHAPCTVVVVREPQRD